MAPRNFDSEQPTLDELTFVVAGEQFQMQLCGPGVLAHFEDLGLVTTGAEAVERARERTTAFLREEDRERWTKLLDEDKIPYRTLQSIQTWMVEVQSDRPTERPSGAASGAGSTGGTSKGRRSSPASTPDS